MQRLLTSADEQRHGEEAFAESLRRWPTLFWSIEYEAPPREAIAKWIIGQSGPITVRLRRPMIGVRVCVYIDDELLINECVTTIEWAIDRAKRVLSNHLNELEANTNARLIQMRAAIAQEQSNATCA